MSSEEQTDVEFLRDLDVEFLRDLAKTLFYVAVPGLHQYHSDRLLEIARSLEVGRPCCDYDQEKAREWLLSGKTGISSLTIFQVMAGVQGQTVGTPWDAGDLNRCVMLLDIFPQWRLRLHEVSEAHPEWEALINNWEELEHLLAVHKRSKYQSDQLYLYMQDLLKESIRA